MKYISTRCCNCPRALARGQLQHFELKYISEIIEIRGLYIVSHVLWSSMTYLQLILNVLQDNLVSIKMRVQHYSISYRDKI